MKRFGRIAALLALATLLAACYSAPAARPSGPPPASASGSSSLPSFSIASPAEGATVSGSDVQVSVKADNFIVKGAGGPNQSNEGHLHMYLDGGAVTMVYGNSHTISGVPAGNHTLVVELVNNDHSSSNPPIKKTVSFNVGSGGASPSGGGNRYGY